VITTVSETYHPTSAVSTSTRSRRPVAETRPASRAGAESLFPVNLEIVLPDTQCADDQDLKPVVTTNNDAPCSARLAQSLWDDVGETRRQRVQTVGLYRPGAAASRRLHGKLARLWDSAEIRSSSARVPRALPAAQLRSAPRRRVARWVVQQYAARTRNGHGTGRTANRLGEQKARVETFLHVWDTRYIPSIKPGLLSRMEQVVLSARTLDSGKGTRPIAVPLDAGRVASRLAGDGGQEESVPSVPERPGASRFSILSAAQRSRLSARPVTSVAPSPLPLLRRSTTRSTRNFRRRCAAVTPTHACAIEPFAPRACTARRSTRWPALSGFLRNLAQAVRVRARARADDDHDVASRLEQPAA
jgi:hypothetical protein